MNGVAQVCQVTLPLIENTGTISHSPIITGNNARAEIHYHFDGSISPDALADAYLAKSEGCNSNCRSAGLSSGFPENIGD
jgi:hypothetical protein